MGPRGVGASPHSSLPPPRPPDPSQFKSKVLAHKEEIAERFNKLSKSMTAFATEQERFGRELREDLRQLRLSYGEPSSPQPHSNPPTTTISAPPTTTISAPPPSSSAGTPTSPSYCQSQLRKCQLPQPLLPLNDTDVVNNQITINPINTVSDATRLIGRRFSDSSVQGDMNLWLFKVFPGPNDKLMVNVTYQGEEKQMVAEGIVSMVLISIREMQVILEDLKSGKGHELEHCFFGMDKRVRDKGGGHTFQLRNNHKVITTISHDPQYWKSLLNGFIWGVFKHKSHVHTGNALWNVNYKVLLNGHGCLLNLQLVPTIELIELKLEKASQEMLIKSYKNKMISSTVTSEGMAHKWVHSPCRIGFQFTSSFKLAVIDLLRFGFIDKNMQVLAFPMNIISSGLVSLHHEHVNNLEDAHELIDTAISTSLKESKFVYVSIDCNLAGSPHPAFSLEHVPFSLSPKLSNTMGLEVAVEVAAEFLNKVGKPVMVGEPKLRAALAGDAVVELADASGFALAVMPSVKGMVPKHHPHFIGTYWGAVSTAFCAKFVESADAYLFAWPIFNDYSSVGYSLLLKKEKVIIVQPDRVTIGNGPTFGCVLMKDFFGGLAKRLKHNNATHENYHRIFVPDGHPLKAAPKEPLRVNVLFQHIQMMMSTETAVIAETGDSWFNCQKLKLPPGCGFEFQMQYGSIGWSVGATLGYTQAVPEKRVISFIRNGSFQVTAQDSSTMIRMGQWTIIFLINNGGYTIEVEIHDGPYNVIKNWNYTGLVDATHNERAFINKLVGKMEGVYFAAKLSLVELLAIFISTQERALKPMDSSSLDTDVNLLIFLHVNFNLFVYVANVNLGLDIVMLALSCLHKCKKIGSSCYNNNEDKGMMLFDEDGPIPNTHTVHEVDCQLQDVNSLLALLKHNLYKAQVRIKRFHDKRHTQRTFEVSDLVYMKLQSYKQQSAEKRTVHKLSVKYYRPFEVTEKVLDTMLVKRKGRDLAKWQIQWLGTSIEESTWEEAVSILQRYPDFQT